MADESVSLVSDNSDRIVDLFRLAKALKQRFEITKSLDDLDNAIQFLNSALEVNPNPKVQLQLACLDLLGDCLTDRLFRRPSLEDIDSCFETRNKAVNLTPPAQTLPTLIRQFDLGNVCLIRFQRKRTGADLEKATELFQTVLSANEPLLQTNSKVNLGSCFVARFNESGAFDDLNAAINLFEQEIAIIYVQHRYVSALWLRFEHTGSSDGLNVAIKILQNIVKGPNVDSRYLCDLGIALSRRSERNESLKDLELAIDALRRSVQGADPSLVPSISRAVRLSNLAGALLRRFQWTLNDFRFENSDEAIGALLEAIEITPETFLQKAGFYNNLGTQYSARFDRAELREDLDKSIKFRQEAIEAAHSSNSPSAMYFRGLGDALRKRFEQTQSAEDLAASIDAFQRGFSCSTSPLALRISSAARGAHLARTTNPRVAQDLLTAAVELLPLASPNTLHRRDQQFTLSQFSDLAMDAAAMVLSSGGEVYEALRVLELGRGVMTSHLLNTRTDLSDLAAHDPETAATFIRLSEELDRRYGSDISAEPQRTRLYAVANEFDEVIEGIRHKHGFENFLRGPTRAELQSLANDGPIVCLNASQYRCDAFLITLDGLRLMPLTDLKYDDVVRHATNLRAIQSNDILSARQQNIRALREILQWLWDVVVSPVLDSLGLMDIHEDGDDWPRIWWVPTGYLTLFPLHAAGYMSRDGRNTLDRVISSYSPTIRALAYSRSLEKQKTNPDQVLMIVMPETPNHRSLPFASHEVRVIDSLLPSVIHRQICEMPTKSDVVEALSSCSIVHFSCHGTIDADPSKSYILLVDWETEPFRVADMVTMKLKNIQLAYFSACHSANTGDDALLDESIHIASACQLAGIRSVIGTLWHVSDSQSAQLTEYFYSYVVGPGKFDFSRAARALHFALRKSREDAWLIRFQKPLDSALFWAPFTYVGI